MSVSPPGLSHQKRKRENDWVRSDAMQIIQPFQSLEACFGDIPDPRVVGRCDHNLVEIIMVAVCAVLCGAENWSEVEEFGEAKADWLKHYLDLPAGIPSHDTFSRVFRLLDATAFQTRFMKWVENYFSIQRGQVIAVDGKTVRGSRDRFRGQEAIHLVSAFAHESGLLLGQRKVDAKSNEIKAVPELLKTLFIRGCIVTVDALNCQKDIAQTIVEGGADYVFALKANHPQLHQDVVDWFSWAKQRDFRDIDHTFYETINKAHGRIEIRRCYALSDPTAFQALAHYDGWANLRSIAMVHRERRFPDRTQAETAYFLSSLPPDAHRILDATRAHWSVENTFHWTLDVTFAEDAARVRLDNAPENFAVIRHLAFNLLKRHPAKTSLKRKRFRAALNDSFLFDLLTQF
jgi:predicted transposase YbfD/YdcC